MNWLLDLGNSRLKAAPWTPGEPPGPAQAWPHGSCDFPDSLSPWLAGLSGGDTCWLASVASAEVTAGVAGLLSARGCVVRRALTRAAGGGVRIAYPEPSRLGIDRFLALLAAHARGPGPWLLVSAGSALTVDLLGQDGQHHGGVIAPSPEHMRAALAARFPALAYAGGEARAFATDTADALAGGSLGAAAGLVERSLREATRRLGQAPTVLVSGGGASRLAEALECAWVPAPSLVIEGLAVYAADVAETDE